MSLNRREFIKGMFELGAYAWLSQYAFLSPASAKEKPDSEKVHDIDQEKMRERGMMTEKDRLDFRSSLEKNLRDCSLDQTKNSEIWWNKEHPEVYRLQHCVETAILPRIYYCYNNNIDLVLPVDPSADDKEKKPRLVKMSDFKTLEDFLFTFYSNVSASIFMYAPENMPEMFDEVDSPDKAEFGDLLVVEHYVSSFHPNGGFHVAFFVGNMADLWAETDNAEEFREFSVSVTGSQFNMDLKRLLSPNATDLEKKTMEMIRGHYPNGFIPKTYQEAQIKHPGGYGSPPESVPFKFEDKQKDEKKFRIIRFKTF